MLIDLYTQKIMIAALTDLSGPAVGDRLFSVPLVDRQLAALDLPPTELRFPPGARTQELLLSQDPYAYLNALWESDHAVENDWLAAAAIDRLLDLTGEAPSVWQARLLRARTLEAWLAAGGVTAADFFAGVAWAKAP